MTGGGRCRGGVGYDDEGGHGERGVAFAAARRRTAAYLDLLAELDLDGDDRAHAWRVA
jgi:hypothetical protein